MSFYTKTDLIFQDYKWTAFPSDDPKITGTPDSTLFNRHEGYEVLYLINKLASIWGLKQKGSGEKMETMIRKNLPSDIRSQANVRAWIHSNWDK